MELLADRDPEEARKLLDPVLELTVNVHEAKTHFSRLLDRTQEGQEFVIAKAGRPVARLGPLARQGKNRRLGLLDGKFSVPDDFNEPLPDEVIAAFEGPRR
ncbi:MAG: type II toxin-antitoxin system Phd/YefM family antitoxin [Thermoanaerobaculia bacterium]